jgi:glutamyl-tRNA reductase
MLLLVKGMNHYTAPVAVREKFSLSESALGEVSLELKRREGLDEALVLCTCNRTEMYVCAPSRAQGLDAMRRFMAWKFQQEPDAHQQKWFYRFEGLEAAEHLFRVSAGIDSMILGEGQVLHQVKAAYMAAMESGATGETLNALFNQAVKVGKRARAETEISRHAVSVAHAAIDMARRVFNDLRRKSVLIVGAGKMCEVACKYLLSQGPADITVANRTVDKAREIAGPLGAMSVPMDRVPELLETADVIISSTAAPHYVIRLADVRRALPRRRGHPLFIADIAVPRDVEPEIGRLPNVFLYNIDDLKTVVHENLEKRRKEIVKVETIIMRELSEWQAWLAAREALPVLTAFRSKINGISEKELDKALRKLNHLSENDQQAVRLLTGSIVNKILHNPTVRLKEAAAQQDGNDLMETLQKLFDLEADTPSAGDSGEGKE